MCGAKTIQEIKTSDMGIHWSFTESDSLIISESSCLLFKRNWLPAAIFQNPFYFFSSGKHRCLAECPCCSLGFVSYIFGVNYPFKM